jgi:hypothetical protein
MANFSYRSGSSAPQSKAPNWFQFFFTWLFPLPFLTVGALLLFFGVRSYQSAQESSGWPTSPGVVLSSSVDSHRSDDSTTYQAEVLYEYEVSGEKYSSNRIGYGDISTGSPAPAQDLVNQYPSGESVTVYVDPEDPSQSVLQPGVRGGTYFLPGMGLLFTLIGLILYAVLPRMFRNQDSVERDISIRPSPQFSRGHDPFE